MKSVMFILFVTSLAVEESSAIIERDDFFKSGKFVHHTNSYLNVEPIVKSSELDSLSCMWKCLETHSCFSINMASVPDSNSKYLCELLATDKYTSSEKFQVNGTMQHFSIESPCDDCLNGAKCQANYEKNTGVCNCKRGYVGKNCEKGCVFPLGMETKSIADSQITASSFVDFTWSPKDGRIRNSYNAGVTWGCWRPATAQAGEYLQVDLLAVKNINKVATQGQPYTSDQRNLTHWVTRYVLSYSLDGITWTTYPEELSGNTDRDTVVSHTLLVTIQTRYIRFVVKEWNVLPAIRVELYGCEACLSPLGMETKSIADSQITASSFVDIYWSPKDARMRNPYNSGVTFGCWQPANAQAGEYLQVDLLAVKNINKVATQGKPYSSYYLVDHWVTRYALSYSLDGITWTTYPHEFSGNSDDDTVVSHTLPVTIQTRYIRFVVKEWNVLPAMRVELYGCDA